MKHTMITILLATMAMTSVSMTAIASDSEYDHEYIVGLCMDDDGNGAVLADSNNAVISDSNYISYKYCDAEQGKYFVTVATLDADGEVIERSDTPCNVYSGYITAMTEYRTTIEYTVNIDGDLYAFRTDEPYSQDETVMVAMDDDGCILYEW